MFEVGAVVGLVVGVVSLVLINEHVPADLRVLASVAVLLPTAAFVIWWLIFPGVALDNDEVEEEPPSLDVRERLQRIEATFDAAAVPRAGRRPIGPVDTRTLDTFRRSIRRGPASVEADIASFGVPRPARTPRVRLIEP